MKFSIEKALKSATHFLLLLMFFLAVVGLILVNERISQKQINLLQQLHNIADNATKLTPKNDTFDMITFQGIRGELSMTLEALEENQASFNPLEPVFPSLKDDEALKKLHKLNTTFALAVKTYLTPAHTSLDALKQQMLQAHQEYIHQMSQMLEESIDYEHRQFLLRESIIYGVIIAGILLFFWMQNRFKLIIYDLQSLYGIDMKEYTIKTTEVEAITNKLKKECIFKENPAHIDTLSGLKNDKGLAHAFNASKAMRTNNAVCFCAFQIDEYSLLLARHSEKFMDSVIKKIASVIALYEQHNDISARLDDSCFILIMPRESKEEALELCDTIRVTIAETNFKTPEHEKIAITLSGGFLVKHQSKSFDTSIAHAIDLLKKAQEKGRNRIAQLRDYV